MKAKSIIEKISIGTKQREIVWEDADLIEAPNWINHDHLIVNSGGLMYDLFLSEKRKRKLETSFAQNCNNDHGITPDGKQLIISSHDPDPNNDEDWKTSKIYALPIEGGEPKLITEKDCSFWHGIAPDGERLAYTACREGLWDIYSISIHGGAEKRLTNTPGHADGADYSPDGKVIYYNAFSSGVMEIWQMNTDGTNHQQLTNDEHSNWFPHPSPDGKYLVYLCYLDDQKEDHPFGKQVKLRIMDLETQKIEDLTDVFYGGQGTINVNSWSEDSKQLAFVRYVE